MRFCLVICFREADYHWFRSRGAFRNSGKPLIVCVLISSLPYKREKERRERDRVEKREKDKEREKIQPFATVSEYAIELFFPNMDIFIAEPELKTNINAHIQ